MNYNERLQAAENICEHVYHDLDVRRQITIRKLNSGKQITKKEKYEKLLLDSWDEERKG